MSWIPTHHFLCDWYFSSSRYGEVVKEEWWRIGYYFTACKVILFEIFEIGNSARSIRSGRCKTYFLGMLMEKILKIRRAEVQNRVSVASQKGLIVLQNWKRKTFLYNSLSFSFSFILSKSLLFWETLQLMYPVVYTMNLPSLHCKHCVPQWNSRDRHWRMNNYTV